MSEGRSAESDVARDGHYGPGSLRAWAECPACNPDDTRVAPPEVPRCVHLSDDGAQCIYAAGHNGRHRYPPRVTPPEATAP